MGNLMLIERFLMEHEIWLKFFTLLGALIIGFFQIKINMRLKALQDYVAISAIPDSANNKITLLNTGKVNLYLWGFDMPGNVQRLNKPRLISAGTGKDSYYWIDLPTISSLEDKQEFEFQLYLTDEFGKKWISENGGLANKIQIEKEGKKNDAFQIILWSYKTYKKKWSIK